VGKVGGKGGFSSMRGPVEWVCVKCPGGCSRAGRKLGSLRRVWRGAVTTGVDNRSSQKVCDLGLDGRLDRPISKKKKSQGG